MMEVKQEHPKVDEITILPISTKKKDDPEIEERVSQILTELEKEEALKETEEFNQFLSFESNRNPACYTKKYVQKLQRERDRLLGLWTPPTIEKSIFICVKRRLPRFNGSLGNKVTFEWYSNKGEIWGTEKITPSGLKQMPFGHICNGAVSVSLNSELYVLGGISSWDLQYPYDRPRLRNIFYSDTSGIDKVWKEGPPMLLGRADTSAVVSGRKIYVFGGSGTEKRRELFGEVFDPMLSRWEPLPDPPEDLPTIVASFDAKFGNKILVHPYWTNSLYAYDITEKSWDKFNENFGDWCGPGVVMGDVLYCYDRGQVYGYDVCNSRWFAKAVEGLEETVQSKHTLARLFCVGERVLCLVWSGGRHGYPEELVIYCENFTVEKVKRPVNSEEEEEVILVASMIHSTCYVVEGDRCVNYIAM